MCWFIRRAGRPVTRDEAAEHVGIFRKLAAFHLDELVGIGLLRAHYEHTGGIRRVGRAPKVYEPADIEVQISIPERRYEILAEILMQSVLTEVTGESAREATLRVAGDRGTATGREIRARLRPGRFGADAPSPSWSPRSANRASNPRAPRRPACDCVIARSTRWRLGHPTWCARSTAPTSPGCSTVSKPTPSTPILPPPPVTTASKSAPYPIPEGSP